MDRDDRVVPPVFGVGALGVPGCRSRLGLRNAGSVALVGLVLAFRGWMVVWAFGVLRRGVRLGCRSRLRRNARVVAFCLLGTAFRRKAVDRRACPQWAGSSLPTTLHRTR